MTKHEQLQENLEDALFALLMEEMAKEEGKRLLEENERLKADPDAEVPKAVNERCLQTIRRHFAKQKMRKAGRFTAKAFGKVAMAAGVAAMLFTGAFAASETVRTTTMNLIVEVFEESTDFYFSDRQPTNDLPVISAGWLPEGFSLEAQDSDNVSTWTTYKKSEYEVITIAYELSDGTLFSMDTEDARVEAINLNGTHATLVVKEQTVEVFWTTTDQTAFILIIAHGITEKDALRIAQEIKY